MIFESGGDKPRNKDVETVRVGKSIISIPKKSSVEKQGESLVI